MILRVLFAIGLICVFCKEVSAAPKLHPRCNIDWPCIAPMSVATVKERQRVARGGYIARQLGWGGVNPKRAVKPRKAAGNLQGNLAGSIPSYGAPSPSIGYTIAKPLTFIAGRLKCALNLNAALAEKGIRGTGSALAHSFDRWGRASQPVPGAVAVTDRKGGGHVALVSRVEGSRVWVMNPGRRGWREIEYTSRRARYRVASQ